MRCNAGSSAQSLVVRVYLRLTEMLVQDIEETVSETPQEEERGGQGEGPKVLPGDETVLEGVAVAGTRDLTGEDSGAGHFDEVFRSRREGGVKKIVGPRRTMSRGGGEETCWWCVRRRLMAGVSQLQDLDLANHYILDHGSPLTGGYGVPRGPVRQTCRPHEKMGNAGVGVNYRGEPEGPRGRRIRTTDLAANSKCRQRASARLFLCGHVPFDRNGRGRFSPCERRSSSPDAERRALIGQFVECLHPIFQKGTVPAVRL